jgi:hypothetical protein
MPIIESFTGFQPLQEVWIGGTYPTSFYSHLSNEVQDTFGRITEQTEIGLANLEKTLTKLNVKVRKPSFLKVDDCMDQYDNLIKPPIAPRDWAMTIGNELWITPQGYKREPYAYTIEEYKKQGEHVEILDRGQDPRSWLGFSAVVRIGKKLIVDTGYPGMTTEGIEHVKKAITILEKDYEVVVTNEGGHLDSVFCPIKQGHIISSHWGVQQLYDETFPGWKVFWIEKQTNKNSNGKWWTEENNFYSPIFNEHVNQKASEWVGDSTETVFEANMLVVDEHNVICIAGHEQSFEKFKQLGITPHVVDFPTRYFWDGGIHCLTVDIRRTGGCLDYFQ